RHGVLADAGPDCGDGGFDSEVGHADRLADQRHFHRVLDGREVGPDGARIVHRDARHRLAQGVAYHVWHEVGAEAASREAVVLQYLPDRGGPLRDRRELAGVLDVRLDRDAEIVASRDVADNWRLFF